MPDGQVDDGWFIANQLGTAMGIGTHSHVMPEADALLSGMLGKAADGFSSDDPVERAEAVRVFGTFLDALGGRGSKNYDAREGFLSTGLAPEEVTSSITGVAQAIGGPRGTEVRRNRGIADSPNPDDGSERPVVKYTGLHAYIAGAYVDVAYGVAGMAEKQEKLLQPSAIFGKTVRDEMVGVLAESGGLGMSKAAIEAEVTTVKDSIVTDMAEAFREQHKVRVRAPGAWDSL